MSLYIGYIGGCLYVTSFKFPNVHLPPVLALFSPSPKNNDVSSKCDTRTFIDVYRNYTCVDIYGHVSE